MRSGTSARSTSSVTPACDPLPPNALPPDFTSSPTVTPDEHQLGRRRLRPAGRVADDVHVDHPALDEAGHAEPVDLDDDPALARPRRIGRRRTPAAARRGPTGRVRTSPSRSSAAERYRPVDVVEADRPGAQVVAAERGVGAEVAGHRPDPHPLVGVGEHLGADDDRQQDQQQADEQPGVEPAGPGKSGGAGRRQLGHPLILPYARVGAAASSSTAGPAVDTAGNRRQPQAYCRA